MRSPFALMIAGALAQVERRQGRLREALTTAREALASFEEAEANPAVAPDLAVTIVGALRELGRLDEAEAEGRRALARYGAGGDNPYLAELWFALADVATDRGRHREAVDPARRGLALLSMRVPEDSSTWRQGQAFVAKHLLAAGHAEEAAQIAAEALADANVAEGVRSEEALGTLRFVAAQASLTRAREPSERAAARQNVAESIRSMDASTRAELRRFGFAVP